MQLSSQGSSVSSQTGLGLGIQAPGFSSISSTSLQLTPNSVHSPSNPQQLMSGVSKDAGMFHGTHNHNLFCYIPFPVLMLNQLSPFFSNPTIYFSEIGVVRVLCFFLLMSLYEVYHQKGKEILQMLGILMSKNSSSSIKIFLMREPLNLLPVLGLSRIS